MPENTTPRLATVYSVECNENIDIIAYYDKGKDEYGDPVDIPVYLAKDVDCYMTMTLERVDNATAGYFVQTITNLILPAKYTLSSKSVVMKNAFVFDDAQKKNVYTKIPYRVESIDTSMMDIVNGNPVGILKCLLTEDR